MARLVEVKLCAYCTEWAWSFRASLQGMGSIDNPTHTQEDGVESLSTDWSWLQWLQWGWTFSQ
eukprot:1151391-Pelagomonas_calceolata.AAC.10